MNRETLWISYSHYLYIARLSCQYINNISWIQMLLAYDGSLNFLPILLSFMFWFFICLKVANLDPFSKQAGQLWSLPSYVQYYICICPVRLNIRFEISRGQSSWYGLPYQSSPPPFLAECFFTIISFCSVQIDSLMSHDCESNKSSPDVIWSALYAQQTQETGERLRKAFTYVMNLQDAPSGQTCNSLSAIKRKSCILCR